MKSNEDFLFKANAEDKKFKYLGWSPSLTKVLCLQEIGSCREWDDLYKRIHSECQSRD